MININDICGDTEPDCVDILINDQEDFLGTYAVCIRDIYDGWRPSSSWLGAPITTEDLKDFYYIGESLYRFQHLFENGECSGLQELHVEVGNENWEVCDEYTPIEVCPQWENNITINTNNESNLSTANVIQIEGEETITISTSEQNLPDQAYIEWYSSTDPNFTPGQSGSFLGSSRVSSNWNACNLAAETLAIQYNGDRAQQADSPEDEYILIGSGSGFYVDDLQLIAEGNCDSSCPSDCATNYGNACGWSHDHFNDTGCDNIISVGSGDFIPPNALVFVFLGTEAVQRIEGYEMLCQLESCVYVMMNNCERCLEAFKDDNSNSNYGIMTSCGGVSTIQYNATRSKEAGSFATKDGLVGFNFYSIPSVLPSDYLIEASVQDVSFEMACNNTSNEKIYVRGIIKSDLYNVDCCSPYTPTITFEQSCPTLPPPNDSTLLDEYTWLPALINQNDCEGIEVTEYTFGSVTFIYIKEGDLGILYYQDGQKYCMDAPGFDCISAYSLVNETGSWDCEEIPDPPNPNEPIFEDYPWLVNYVDVNNCLGTVIYLYEFFGSTFPYFEVDGQWTLFSDLGQVYCRDNPPNFSCVDAYALNELVSIWECGQDCICTAEYNPVCGTDGNTYGNECEAACAGADIDYFGNCLTVVLDPLFISFPWLLDLVSPSDCEAQSSIGLFQVGNFQYLYISETGTIYNNSGQLYCQEYPGFSCTDFYELTPANFIQGWECGTLVSNPHSEALRVEASDGGSSKILGIAEGLSTSVEQLYTSKLDFKLYPNPARNQVTIETTEGHYYYRVLDITGQTLMSSLDAIQGSHTIDLNQEPGLYLFELYNETEHRIRKLIIAE